MYRMLLILEKLKFLLKIKQVVVWKEDCLFFYITWRRFVALTSIELT